MKGKEIVYLIVEGRVRFTEILYIYRKVYEMIDKERLPAVSRQSMFYSEKRYLFEGSGLKVSMFKDFRVLGFFFHSH